MLMQIDSLPGGIFSHLFYNFVYISPLAGCRLVKVANPIEQFRHFVYKNILSLMLRFFNMELKNTRFLVDKDKKNAAFL